MEAVKPLVLVPPGTLTAKTTRELKKAGYLVAEVADPSSLRVVTPPPMVPLAGLAAIALEVVADEKVNPYEIRDTFRRRVCAEAMKAAKGGELAR